MTRRSGNEAATPTAESREETLTTTGEDARISEAELLVLYQDQLDNIRDLKANQLRISHYAVAGQAAYIAMTRLVEVSSSSTWVIAHMVVATALAALWVNHLFQHRVAKRREALDTLSKRPKKSFDKVRGDLRKERRRPPKNWSWSGELRVLIPLTIAPVVAAGLALWVVIAACCPALSQ